MLLYRLVIKSKSSEDVIALLEDKKLIEYKILSQNISQCKIPVHIEISATSEQTARQFTWDFKRTSLLKSKQAAQSNKSCAILTLE